ncbi:MAG: ATP-dependent DNA helicase RecG [Gammaproteobacteria bacterium]
MAECAFWRRLPAAAKEALRRAGCASAGALLLRFPLRYENWEAAEKVSSLQSGQKALVEGTVVDAETRSWRGGRRQLLAQIEDGEGGLLVARFFNATPGLARAVAPGTRLRLLGTVKFGNGWEMAHPKIQFAKTSGKMQAVYAALGGFSQERQRQWTASALSEAAWEETAPGQFRRFSGGDLTAQDALSLIHLPPPDNPELVAQLEAGEHPAWTRLRFDELLAHQILLRARVRRRARTKSPPLAPPPQWDAPLREALPFSLTGAQERAVAEICADLRQTRPMRRLLQGDVGSGKTAVAAFACLAAAKSGQVAALMAPTEILARQHFDALSAYFADAGVQCELLTGAVRGARRRDALARLRLGLSQVAIGTHALFHEEARLPKIALAVVDEQHRFGVEQRNALLAAGTAHQLMMTATPIPRTLAMSAFADTAISALDEMPPGRKKVKTVLAPFSRRAEVLARIGGRKDGAAYWVCPRAQESEGDLRDVLSLVELARGEYPHLSPEVLHGRMPPPQKQEVIDKFRAGKSRFLAATTVIEVGVDVPQADIMVVERAERMGLSQLHQLRGRVGRGGREGICILLYAGDLSEEAKTRLKILRETTDGFKIAEHDLRLRGPGEWLGTRQSGLPPFRVARPGEDPDLVAAAGKAAEWMLDNDRRACFRHVKKWLGGRKRSAE